MSDATSQTPEQPEESAMAKALRLARERIDGDFGQLPDSEDVYDATMEKIKSSRNFKNNPFRGLTRQYQTGRGIKYTTDF